MTTQHQQNVSDSLGSTEPSNETTVSVSPGTVTKDSMIDATEYAFAQSFTNLSQIVHRLARDKGWWKERDELLEVAKLSTLPGFEAFAQATLMGSAVSLIHSELSEALENIRTGMGPDDKIPEFSGVEAELADVIIRIMDFAVGCGLRVPEALIAKVEYNRTRTYKHGGKSI